MRPSIVLFGLATGLSATAVTLAAGGGGYEIRRETIDAAGPEPATGGGYVLESTVGEPAPGATGGGEYASSGGFLISIPESDCSHDGLVNLMDHETLLSCLGGPGTPGVSEACACFDVDHSNSTDLADFAALQRTFTGP